MFLPHESRCELRWNRCGGISEQKSMWLTGWPFVFGAGFSPWIKMTCLLNHQPSLSSMWIFLYSLDLIVLHAGWLLCLVLRSWLPIKQEHFNLLFLYNDFLRMFVVQVKIYRLDWSRHLANDYTTGLKEDYFVYGPPALCSELSGGSSSLWI